MSQDGNVSSGDTLEFLKLVGAADAEPSVGAPTSQGPLDCAPDIPDAGPARRTGGRPAGPIVIKGGPRRVARADGCLPSLGSALGQKHVELSSGNEMFKAKSRPNAFASFVVALVAIVAVVVTVAVVAGYSLSQITQAEQRELIGTGSYDGALSLTPAKDGGYYTAFFVTADSSDPKAIGLLERVVLYRTDASATTAVRVNIPSNLYVAKRNAYKSNYYTLQATLENTQNVTRTLQAICDALDLRLYNVVVCDENLYAQLVSYMAGQTSDTSLFEADALLGEVRTNLSEEGLKGFCDSIRAIGPDNVKEFDVPTTQISAGDVVMLQGSPTSYQAQLQTIVDNRKYDERGNYYGTKYDENGNPILDANGNPYGAIYLSENTLYFDEDGYLVFYGQHYDDKGYPVGTRYDENGNALLDERGNPQGTVYDEWGNPTYDWLGNIVIQNG